MLFFTSACLKAGSQSEILIKITQNCFWKINLTKTTISVSSRFRVFTEFCLDFKISVNVNKMFAKLCLLLSSKNESSVHCWRLCNNNFSHLTDLFIDDFTTWDSLPAFWAPYWRLFCAFLALLACHLQLNPKSSILELKGA